MVKKGKKDAEDLGAMRAARFGRVKNTLSMGFVGLPNVGKSSLTNLLAGANHAEAANYPFCTIDPNVVQCVVPDQKFRYLVDVWKPPSVVPAMLKVTDIAGLIRGASEGAGLGNAFLSHIAAVDGIFHLIRAFESDEVIHVDDSVDPVRDLETIQGELCAKDKETLTKVMEKEKERVRKEKGLSRSADVPLAESFLEAYAKCEKLINDNIPVQTHEDFSMAEVECIKDWGLITTKPMIYVVNLSQKNFIRKGSKFLPKINQWVKEHGGGQIIPVSCEFEETLQGMQDDHAQQKAFLQQCTEEAEAAGLKGPQAEVKSMIPRLIRAGRQALCLQSFYTAGPKEVRAWTIMQGTLAPQAAGVIHTDFERGFIKAEVCAFDDFKALHQGQASMAKIKEAGKYRQEGKTYAMQEGDIVVFMHNVTTAKKK
ncbi:ribosome-binding ATPase [Fistulifera solaris]|uniref:Obg-like ATPase homolog n=1 Tax=Fistulifera solaris TaxID=1519565 RepID=A0A1Z5JUM5_FISSO|nr:ribosome-binding ATPase [Fistulifera solaris]|eukprot:GAX17743.1 ribosome-binding ATPase [Fistulifera solaris]